MIRPMLHRRSLQATLVLVVLVASASCGDGGDPASSGRTASGADRPSSRELTSAPVLPDPVDVEEAVLPLDVSVGARSGYENAEGEWLIDVFEGESIYPMLSILDAKGRPVRGVRPTVTAERDTRVIPVVGGEAVSDDSGLVPFGLTAGTMGLDRIEVTAGEAVASVTLNVISQRATGYSWLQDIEGVLDWNLLFQAEVRWEEQQISATFPPEIAEKNGQTVKLAGFMMPLEATAEQSHFVVTSNPPDCFFHLPGGAAGAVEVFAAQPLAVSWDPVVLEGRFETLEANDVGVLYRLHDARAVQQESRSSGS